MKIVYVTERMPFGRGESFIIPEVKGLLSNGHLVLILPLGNDPPVHGSAVEDLLPLAHVISLLSPSVALAVLWSCIRHPVRIARVAWLLRRSSSLKQLYRNLVAVLKGVRAAALVSRWGAEHVHAHWANYTATVAMTVGELTGIPWSFTAHRYDIVARNLLAEKDHRAVFVRYISKSGQALASERVGYDTSERSYVLHMGVSLPPVTARLEGTHPSTFVCSASLTPVKGHRILIEAVAALRRAGLSCEVLLLGDGPLRNELAEQVASAGLQGCVRFLGQLPHNEVLSLYSTGIITAAVLPSLDLGGGLHEGIPVSLIEAMSYGVPVIGTSTGGIPELLGGGAGVLVPPANANALAQAMQQLIEHPEYRAELGVAARRRVNESFNIEVVCSKLEELFDCPTRATDERTAVPLS